jgi:hypothetical protein
MIFRAYFERVGGHTHIRLFAGSHEGALGKCGNLCMRNAEFEIFKAASLPIQWRPEARRALEEKP